MGSKLDKANALSFLLPILVQNMSNKVGIIK